MANLKSSIKLSNCKEEQSLPFINTRKAFEQYSEMITMLGEMEEDPKGMV